MNLMLQSNYHYTDQAISHLVEQKLSSALATNEKGEITGLFTARDLLRILHEKSKTMSNKKSAALELIVKDVMTKKEKMVTKNLQQFFCDTKLN